MLEGAPRSGVPEGAPKNDAPKGAQCDLLRTNLKFQIMASDPAVV